MKNNIILIGFGLSFIIYCAQTGCASLKFQMVESNLHQVDELMQSNQKVSSVPPHMHRLPDDSAPTPTPTGTGGCRNGDVGCWRYEYVQHVTSSLDKHELSEMLARVVGRSIELNERVERAELELKHLKRSRL